MGRISLYELARREASKRVIIEPLLWTQLQLDLLSCTFSKDSRPAQAMANLPPIQDHDNDARRQRLLGRWHLEFRYQPCGREELIWNFLCREQSLPLTWRRDDLFLCLGGHRHVRLPCSYVTLNDRVPIAAYTDIEMIDDLRMKLTWPYKDNRVDPPNYRLKHILKKRITPKQRLRDPYLVALLIALGQLQWRMLGEKKTRQAAGVKSKLVFSTKESLFMYSANISSSLLKMFENPRAKQTAPGSLAVQVFTIQFRPVETFRALADPRTHQRKVEDWKGKKSLCELVGDGKADWSPAASNWKGHHLLACRVICKEPQGVKLPLLEKFWPNKTEEIEVCLKQLIQGPAKPQESADDKTDLRPNDMAGLRQCSELLLVRSYTPDSLGYIWSGLARLLNSVDENPVQRRSNRDRGPPPGRGIYADSSKMNVAGSEGGSSEPSSDSDNASSVVFVERVAKPLLEEATLYFANNFIRCILNYGQNPLDKINPLELVQEHNRYTVERGALSVNAVDDGSIRESGGGFGSIAALVEAKRSLRGVDFPNEVLAQLVGQALALKMSRDRTVKTASRTEFVTIFVAGFYMRLFHFTITDNYVDELLKPFGEAKDVEMDDLADDQEMADQELGDDQGGLDDDSNTFMIVHSTKLLNLRSNQGRKAAVRNIIALTRGAPRQFRSD
ncbi:hypothetical protein CDD80_6937 [Ophiocordyceps camponoti-rufipedis]|uniref:Uncharacterized protein n=1 Tax=Ophiocordyceps camponoti-rufipedis TaxID=2004952 RepID=A0A2C5YQL5_9HYPO|nr:hypothetical protein CDD80_6937 [Ophiocordyceps camponoti-rufipedis]